MRALWHQRLGTRVGGMCGSVGTHCPDVLSEAEGGEEGVALSEGGAFTVV